MDNTPYMQGTEQQETNTPEIVEVDSATDNEEELPSQDVVIDGRVYKPNMWKPGQSGNPAGRPKGKTMKEWVKDYLSRMSDEERDAFVAGIPKEVIWRMAEGNPSEDKNIQISVPKPILGGITQANARLSDKGDENEALNAPVSLANEHSGTYIPLEEGHEANVHDDAYTQGQGHSIGSIVANEIIKDT